MPLKLNVGLNRKVGTPNYGSRGASINLELELDSAVVDSPDRLRDRIRHLYSLANTSINEELGIGAALNNGTAPASRSRVPQAAPGNGHGQAAVNGVARRATPSQIRALQAIARRRNVNLAQLLHERFGVDSPDRLAVPEASRLIGELETRPAAEPA
jgi:hypothetical protein